MIGDHWSSLPRISCDVRHIPWTDTKSSRNHEMAEPLANEAINLNQRKEEMKPGLLRWHSVCVLFSIGIQMSGRKLERSCWAGRRSGCRGMYAASMGEETLANPADPQKTCRETEKSFTNRRTMALFKLRDTKHDVISKCAWSFIM
jgi:hypothetical protein